MKLNKKIFIKISYLIILIATFIICASNFIEAAPRVRETGIETEAKVAYFTESNFFEEIKDDKGNITRRLGYGYDLLQTIGQYENMNYTYDKCNRAEGLEKLKNGEVDLMLGISKTDERAKSGVLFPQLPMGTETYYLYTTEEHQDDYIDYSNIEGKTIAVEKSSILATELDSWNTENDLHLNIVEFDTQLDNNFDQILKDTNADLIAYCDIYLTMSSGLYPVCEFGASEIYLAVSSNRKDLLDLINSGQTSILLDNQAYLTDLASKYFNDTPTRRMLSSLEKTWILQNKVLNIGYYDYFPFVTDKDNSAEGVFVEVLKSIFEKFNIEVEFKYQKYSEYSKMINDLRNGTLDLIMPSYGSIYKAENENVLVTQSVIASKIKIIYANEKFDNVFDDGITSGYTIAILEDSPLQKNFVNEYLPNCNVLICADLADCLKNVKNGKADFTIISNYRQSTWLSEKDNYYVKDTDYIVNYKYAVSNESNSLLTIINRGLNIIGSENIQNYMVSYIEKNQTVPFSFGDFVKNHIAMVIVIVIILVVVIMIALYWGITKTKVRHNLERLVTHDPLTGILNRRAYNHALQSLKKTQIPHDFVVYVSDIDNLKQTNDTIGHDAGDELIKTYADIVNRYFSQIGTLYKTGGDEFIGLLYTDKETLIDVMDEIKNICSYYKGELIDKVDFSYGIAFASDYENPNIDKLFHIAENAMYKLKESKKEYVPEPKNVTKSYKGWHDSLTKLYTMEEFYRIYNDQTNDVYNLSNEPVIICFNINSFKRYNKRYGFDEGTRLLKDLGDVLAKVFGNRRCSRFSEDRFFCITPNYKIDEKIKQVFKEFDQDHSDRFVTLRAGVCTIDGTALIETYCDEARLACDSDKSEYESHYVKYTRKIGKNYEIRQYVLENIDNAIKNGEIVAFYQPKVNPHNNKLVGFEALARWNSAEKGMISPGDFIPVLDEYNVTYKVDFEILKQTAKHMHNMLKKGLKPYPVSFNISRIDFNVLDICSEINNILDMYELPHRLFQIEITETTILSNLEFIKKEVSRFKENGYDVLMDDFGSAYSSLGTLREIDFDEIKIDGSFMFNFSQKSRTILDSTLNLCKELKIKACVEGVETFEQVQYLKKLKVDEIQGYYYGKPLDFKSTIDKWFNKNE